MPAEHGGQGGTLMDAVLAIEQVALAGYRNLPRGDLDAVADAIVRLSELARLRGVTVLDAEINPLIVKPAGQGVIAVDGLARLRRPG
ncbi:MAG: hypothetical protein FJX35_23935 [Alphaproteobacteria bacterium]|nr:hypothetical protein [Alphaproteobacteria bacterium]